MYIYLITNTINGKQYIGQTTKNVEVRLSEHLRKSAKNKGYAIHRAIAKYGWDNFKVDILTNCLTQEHLNAEELRLITKFNTQVPNGYNLTAGGDGGGKHSEQTKKLMSEMRKGKGMPDACLKASKLALSNRVISEETHRKLSEAQKGNKKRLNDHKSEQERLKISLAQRGDKNHAAKLTWDIVNSIRSDYSQGMRVTAISCKYNLGHGRISSIVNYRAWVPDGMFPNTVPIKPKKDSAVLLTWEMVNSIREDYAAGMRIIDIHRKYAIPTTTLGRIVHFQSWIPS